MSFNPFRAVFHLLGRRRGQNTPITAARKAKRDRGPQGHRRPDLELLEDRLAPAQLVADVLGGTPSTAVVGTVTEISEGNAVKGWTVYLDLDQSGTLNTDAAGALEPSAVTNNDGEYTIGNLKPGTYRVAEVLPVGWTAVTAVSQDVTVTLDQATQVNFSVFQGGDIVGTVWNDFNEDGLRDTGEPGLAGWTVFVDLNKSRGLDSGDATTVTDADGRYEFLNLPAGDYKVYEVLPTGWDLGEGIDNPLTVTVKPGEQSPGDFGNFSTTSGSIEGTVWNDLNGDGVRQTDPDTGEFTEPGLAGWTVFLDANSNGALDDGETTAATDADGNFRFLGLLANDYDVTEVLPDGWDIPEGFDLQQTVRVRGGEVSGGVEFANFTVLNGSITGTVWNDVNRDGVRNAGDLGLGNWTVFIDLNHDGVAQATEPIALTDPNGTYTFADLQVGEYEVREVLPTGWEPSAGFSDSYDVRVYSGTESVAPDFANFNDGAPVPGSVSGVVWNDANGNGVRDSGDDGLAGWTVFVDANGNRTPDTGEPTADSAADGSYTITGVNPGTVTVVEQVKPGWRATAPTSGVRTVALKNAGTATGLDFGNYTLKEAAISGTVFADTNKDGSRQAGERGLAGITVYLDVNGNSSLDPGEPETTTSADQFYTPGTDEAGSYRFTHLAAGSYTVRYVLPAELGATPADRLQQAVTLTAAEDRTGVDCAAVFRPSEIHGVKYDDANGNHTQDEGEPGIGGVMVYIDLDRDDVHDADEPSTMTGPDGSYSFTDLEPGAYVVRAELPPGREPTYPETTGGILWPAGVSNPAVGDVSPTSITTSLAAGESSRQTVSITLPGSGSLTNLVDVFLLFDDTGSFVNNSPIVRGAFPAIIAQLQTSLSGIDLGFGVGRFEEYANFAAEYPTGRPFVLNQPIVAAGTAGYLTAIQAALDRATPGYGGDQPETDIEALYQLVTGLGFDGNNNGSVLDSGVAGLAATQVNPGASGDVPSFASFTADPANNVMAPAGTLGGGGFRAGALPVILLATDTGFAYQPKGETTVTGVGGVSVPVSRLTGTSRPTTPFNSGAGLQETITGLNALGALVIGLGTNAVAAADPRQGLEAISALTGAVNRSAVTIANGTADPIAPGDPLYFQIASGFASSVAAGVVNAIQNAVTAVAVDVTVQASDPRVKITNHTGTLTNVGAGQTASFDIEFVGDGVPHRFDLQFVRAGTNVVLGSIPVVLGTPIPGDGYEFEDVEEGEIEDGADFGSHEVTTTVRNPTITVTGGTFDYDGTPHAASATAVGIDGTTPVAGSFSFTYNGSALAPTAAGTYPVVATFTSTDPGYAGGTGTGTITINAVAPTLAVTGGTFTYDGNAHAAVATATGLGGVTVAGSFSYTYNGLEAVPTAAGTYTVEAAFTSSDANYTGAKASGSLTINAATPAFSNLSSPTVPVGTASVTLSGHLAAGAVAPAGASVSVTVNGVSRTATVDGSGDFSLSFPTAGLTPGGYPITYAYAGDGGNFHPAADGAGTLTVAPVSDAPQLITQPNSQVATAGAEVTFSAAATGTPPPAVQWQVSWNGGRTFVNLPGATGPTLTLTARTLLDGTQYRAVFTNPAGRAVTEAATLTVEKPPQVILNPWSRTALAGQTVTFLAAALGSPWPQAQWQVSTDGGKTFTDIGGATGLALRVTATADQNGYLYRAVFTNPAGQTYTEAARLTVRTPLRTGLENPDA